jgi:dolichol-phosphate mannosyltransferase
MDRRRDDPADATMTVTDPPVVTLSIIITAYEDAEAIPGLAQEIVDSMRSTGLSWEAIWIDDGSTDATLQRLQALPAPHRYRSFDRNYGQSAGYRAGAEAARGTWLATLDGDGQNDPADLPRLLAEAERTGVDLVIGVRADRQDGWLRRISARCANRLRNLITGVTVTDAGCATRVIRRERFLHLPFFHGDFYFFPVLTVMCGGRFCELPVNHRPRRHGRANYGIRNRLVPGIMDLIGVCWLMRRHRRWLVRQEAGDGSP